YAFAGWATKADGAVAYADGANYTMAVGGATLFAKWTANDNTITFYANFGTTDKSSQTIKTGESATLTLNAFVNAGYTFAGWATTAVGTVVEFADGVNYTMGTTNVELFAVWTANDNTITFNPNGGVGTMAGQKVKTGEMATMTANAFTRDGYTFAGWATTAGGEKSFNDQIKFTMGTESFELFAVWTAFNYTIKFNYDSADGNATLTEMSATYGAAFTCPIPTKTGFVFQGWYDGATQYTDNLGVSVATLKGANNAVYNLTAKWVGTAADMTLTDDGTSATLTKYKGNAQYVVIPETYNNKPVTKIDIDAFNGNKRLKLVTIPNSVTTIGAAAFAGCTELTSVTIPNSVETIKREAFRRCRNLTNFVFEKNSKLTRIEAWAFYDSNIKEFTLPASVTTLDCDLNGHSPFINSNIEKFTVENGNRKFYVEGNCLIDRSTMTLIAGCYDSIIPTNVTAIGDCAFYGTGLTSITIPDSVTSIGMRAFSICRELTSVTIGSGVTAIKYDAFSECTGLTSITIPRAVTSIADGILNACLALTSITVEAGNATYKSDGNCLIEIATNTLLVGCQNSVIPQGVTSIGANAFYFCARLRSITIPDSVTSIGKWAFANCSALTSFTIGSNVKTIGMGAFYECKNLTSVTIPNGVTTIGEKAFSFCKNLTSIIIPSTVTTIDANAFLECAKLATINCEAADPGAGKQPAGWAANWLGDCAATVGWGYKG
ncbi:MAG: leucine-rich repeat protein, partial [Clostridia bacterium]